MSEEKVIIYTPIPLVWGCDGKREAWWNLELDRLVLMTPTTDPMAAALELWEGGICDEHGFHLDNLCGMSELLEEAFAWVAGGELPISCLVN